MNLPFLKRRARVLISNCRIESHDGYLLVIPQDGYELEGRIKNNVFVEQGGGTAIGVSRKVPTTGRLRLWFVNEEQEA